MKTKLMLSAVLCVLLDVSTVRAQGTLDSPSACSLTHSSGASVQRLTSRQRPRTYRLFVPPGYDGHERLPLVLNLHGSGGTAEDQASYSGLERLATGERFLVASLQGENNVWNVPVQAGRPDDVAYVGDVIDHVGAQVCTDDARVYATGFSGGARMSSLLGCMLGSRLAAIAPVSGLRFSAPCTGRPVPVLSFHGLADPQNTYEGHVPGRGGEWQESVPEALAGWAAHNKCRPNVALEDPPGPLSTMRYEGCAEGAEVRLIRIDGLGHAWTRKEVDTTAVMWQFFKSHKLR
jgi:polyhydroxybutyrate depolymerase